MHLVGVTVTRTREQGLDCHARSVILKRVLSPVHTDKYRVYGPKMLNTAVLCCLVSRLSDLIDRGPPFALKLSIWY